MDIDNITSSVGYCGLICELCHLSDKCDGCRSNKNCCGRHLSESGCYQYNCCIDKKINGCWECEDSPCDMDMFSNTHDIRLRAFICCAREEGIKKLVEYVVKNQENGILYGHNKDYDNLENEEVVLKLLRTGKK